MEMATLSSGIIVRPYRSEDAAALLDTVDTERDRLARWMPWVPFATTVGSFEAFINEGHRHEEEGVACHRALDDAGRVVGGIGASIGLINGDEAEVGFWIVAARQGEGVITESVALLIDWLFAVVGMHRVSLRAATGNVRSRAVADRLGFTLEGVLRSSLLLRDHHEDAAVYSVLEDEWGGA